MSLRYHVVSIAAVLLALALGVVLGASALSGRVLGALTSDRDQLAGEVVQMRGERDAVGAQLLATQRLVGAGAPSTVAGVLPGRGVAVLAAPGADPADVDAVSDLVTRAGGRVTGQVALTDAAVAPDRAEALRALVPRLLPAGAQLPTTTDTGTLTGSLLGSLLVARPGGASERTTGPEVATALRALSDAGYVRTPEALGSTPGELALVVTGAGADPARDTVLARIAGEMDRVGAGAVLAGRTGSGAVGTVRADPALRTGLSTVDALEGPASRVATVLALREQADGRTGVYGPAAGTFTPQPAAG
ncbi:copper transport outer membrane protein MctB [Actinomycetospora succinea]|uniref:Copper transport outer membrane protein MctB n=1 Tax=Actinomycetospora succinea TaxID=663603 RepID=A0A4R6UN81_9PSEU|nr:copper transporter [Actinomycetospora succinea]TDQ46923.1 copper transport outer membrane protein MctB [Actinomycetospora succinea]